MALREYKRKRNFRQTPEPAGTIKAHAGGKQFVIQKHAARRLHYDFRLELDGVLKSWAVPKGPSLDPQVKALAVEVEDHPLEYADFEGVIPEGQYGGGTVMVWDRGTWQPTGDANQGLRKGKLDFQLDGERLHGRWTLVRMHRQPGDGNRNNWLLFKRDDAAARPESKLDVKARKTKSVVTGRTMKQIAAAEDRVWDSDKPSSQEKHNGRPAKSSRKTSVKKKPQKHDWNAGELTGAKPGPLPKLIRPQLATLVAQIPRGDEWLHELKFDGYRLLAWIDHGQVELRTRNGNDWTDRFPSIAEALRILAVGSAILDGEIVALDESGGTDFQRLQNWMQHGDDKSLVYYVFDLPYLDGCQLFDTPLVERKQVLARILETGFPSNAGQVRYSDHIQGQGRQVLQRACRSIMEGVVSKRSDSPYIQGRTKSWVKTKCLQRQEFVIGGYTQPSGSRTGFGSLLLGYYEEGRLVYCGNVGTGFTHDSLRQIHRRLKALHSEASPFDPPPGMPRRQRPTWVKPELVGEVEFSEWTEDGMLRHPSFQGLREDKPAREIKRERPTASALHQNGRPRKGRSSKAVGRKENGEPRVAGVTLSHPGRVVYPEAGLTKLDLARYYESIADWILPHVANRPLTLVRCPQGQQHHCFYQKHLTKSMPAPLRGVKIEEKGGAGQYVVLDDLAGLVTLVQMGVLEIHPWGSQADDLERPDRLVFDLDPGAGANWKAVVAAARRVHEYLDELGLQSFLRTSGGKGLHVVVPLARRSGWDEIKRFCQSLAVSFANQSPDLYVATMSKALRRGRIFIDYLRNQRGATAVASYSTRARPHAPVATPLGWDELSARMTSDKFTVTTLPWRLARLKSDPWEGFFDVRQTITAKMQAAVEERHAGKVRSEPRS